MHVGISLPCKHLKHRVRLHMLFIWKPCIEFHTRWYFNLPQYTSWRVWSFNLYLRNSTKQWCVWYVDSCQAPTPTHFACLACEGVQSSERKPWDLWGQFLDPKIPKSPRPGKPQSLSLKRAQGCAGHFTQGAPQYRRGVTRISQVPP